jgi:hypothetical protein
MYVRVRLRFTFLNDFYSHMGITVVDRSRGDVDKIIDSLKATIEEAKAAKKAS